MSKSFYLIISLLIVYSIQDDHCIKKEDDLCLSCELGYYLDKSLGNKCLDSYFATHFHNCNETEDGLSCSVCDDGFFLAKNNECVNTKNCKKSKKRNALCAECNEGFYLLDDGLFCSSTKHCAFGDRETAKCNECSEGFYLDANDDKCKSNEENNKFKNCKKGGDTCDECIYGYYLGEDNLCSLSKNCSISDQNGKCTKCAEGYFLTSSDSKCTKVEKCLKADNYFDCEECEKYLLLNNTKCVPVNDWEISKFTNCKNTDKTGVYCEECKQNYFLNQKNNFCVLNRYMKKMKNCAKSDKTGDVCEKCEDGFYLGSKDKICTKTNGCAYSEDGICQQCQSSFCLNGKNNDCILNNYYDISIYYQCQKTDKTNSKCILCEKGYVLQNGKCFDTLNCKSRPYGDCMQCNNNYCLNHDYGCINTNIDHCRRCDSSDINRCTACEPGYRLDEKNNECIKCKKGCATCTNETNCGSCKEGYFLTKRETRAGDYDVECKKCLKGCKSCFDEFSCISCKEGFYNVRGNKDEENMVCGKCSEGCLECDGPLNCLKCDEKYYLAASGISKYCLKLL